ncbi:MAG: hypothetical protein V7L01_31645 [Nostoc sp.]
MVIYFITLVTINRHRLGNREEAIADLQESAQIALKHQNTIFHQKAIDFMSEIQS